MNIRDEEQKPVEEPRFDISKMVYEQERLRNAIKEAEFKYQNLKDMMIYEVTGSDDTIANCRSENVQRVIVIYQGSQGYSDSDVYYLAPKTEKGITEEEGYGISKHHLFCSRRKNFARRVIKEVGPLETDLMRHVKFIH